jgi:hypothetical protein
MRAARWSPEVVEFTWNSGASGAPDELNTRSKIP